MACSEIDQMRREVCESLQGSLNTWQYKLQAKWGDPRVYEAEQEERQRQDARMVYDLHRRNTQLLSEAYATQETKNKQAHEKRLSTLRSNGYNPSRRPRSPAPAATRTARPAAQRRRVRTATASDPSE